MTFKPNARGRAGPSPEHLAASLYCVYLAVAAIGLVPVVDCAEVPWQDTAAPCWGACCVAAGAAGVGQGGAFVGFSASVPWRWAETAGLRSLRPLRVQPGLCLGACPAGGVVSGSPKPAWETLTGGRGKIPE